MKYVFEDGATAKLSRLFQEAYKPESRADICYADGNGKILSFIIRLLKNNPNENVVAFVDTIYDNEKTIETYNALATYAHYVKLQNRIQVIAIPIICAEYYMLMSLEEFGIIDSNSKEYSALSAMNGWNNIPTSVDISRYNIHSFENFCKWYLNHLAPGCTRGVQYIRSDGLNSNTYYTHKCPCGYKCENTIDIPLEAKALEYVMQYPCYPRGVKEMKGVKSSVRGVDDMITLNHMKCAEINSLIPPKGGRLIPLFSSDTAQFNKRMKMYRILKKISKA